MADLMWRFPRGQKVGGSLVDQLTDFGRSEMLRRILEASEGRPSPSGITLTVEQVVESFRRSALIRQNPDFERNMNDRDGRLYTMGELRRELGLDH